MISDFGFEVQESSISKFCTMVHFGAMVSGEGAPIEEGDEHFRRGLTLSRRGLWEEAIAAYKESLKISPSNAQTYLNLGFVYYELGFDQEAQDAFEKASKLQARSCIR